MEPFLADLINNKKVPQIIRYIIVLVAVGFIIFIGIGTGLHSEILAGKILGFAIAIVFLVLGILLVIRI